MKSAGPINEPIRNYEPGSHERESLKKKLDEMASQRISIPCIIGGKEVRTGNIRKVVMPHLHSHVLAEFHLGGEKELKQAIAESLRAKSLWESLPSQERKRIFLKAADLAAGPYRDVLNAATMLGQSKSVYQAEIDAACELVDFLRFNVHFYDEIEAIQPLSTNEVKNSLDYRPLDGFVAAISPFNFTAIGANLCSAPALVGNTVVWKPSDTQMLSAYYTYQLFKEAGLPDGVINLVAADGPITSEVLLGSKDLAGVHFTGSTQTFQSIWKSVGEKIADYRNYPRIVGETGGKDFVLADFSADIDVLRTALIRGAYEFQGQKCSAASRAYIPESVWRKVESSLVDEIKSIRMGDTRDFSCFMNAVIDERAFKKISSYLELLRTSSGVEVLTGGRGDSSKGYFIEPTLAQVNDPKFTTMREEIFGPVLSVHVFKDSEMEQIPKLIDETAVYALTGAIISEDRSRLEKFSKALRQTAGNIYYNDKCTGAVVGQQPFGGARASGTNDKAGSIYNVMRWLSPRTIKEVKTPAKDYRYPFMEAP